MGWISVDDRLPRDLQPVIGFFDGLGCAVCTYDDSVGCFVSDSVQADLYGASPLDDIEWQPSHWMQMPEEPK